MDANVETKELKKRLMIEMHRKLRKVAEDSYYEFFKQAWEVIEPQTPLLLNWHVKYLCDELQAAVTRSALRQEKLHDILINISPRSLKSMICTVLLQPWAWINYPWLRFINTSYSAKLSTDHARMSRQLTDSAWYQSYWGERWQMTSDQNVKTYFTNDKGGRRFSTSVTGGVTGSGADIIIWDDIINPKEMLTAGVEGIEKANDYYDRILYTRLDNQETGVRIGVMQRLHEDDTSGHVLKKYKGDYKHICIPAEIDGDNVQPHELLKNYSEAGLFFEKRFTRKYLDRLKKAGRRFYLGQILQRPSEKEGNIFKRKEFKRYLVIPARFDRVFQSWDMNFKEGKKNSYVCGQVWGVKGANIYLLDMYRAQVGFKVAMRAFLSMQQKWPESREKYVEDKANGPAIISLLKDNIEGIIPIEPEGSKNARAEAVAYMVESGNVYLPHESICDWIAEALDEITAFPNATFNDIVDALTQALEQFKKGGSIDEWIDSMNDI